MGWVAAAVGLAVFGVGHKAGDKQRYDAYLQTELEYEDSLEKIRRRRFQTDQIVGATKARGENAGVVHTAGSTPVGYLETMEGEFRKELDWMKKFADTARSLSNKRAAQNKKAATWSALSSGISAASDVYSMGA